MSSGVQMFISMVTKSNSHIFCLDRPAFFLHDVEKKSRLNLLHPCKKNAFHIEILNLKIDSSVFFTCEKDRKPSLLVKIAM